MIKNLECPHCGYNGTIAPDHGGPPFTVKIEFPTYLALAYDVASEGFVVKQVTESENGCPVSVLCEECDNEFEWNFSNYKIELESYCYREVAT
jgi:hypothetical protein